MAVMTTFKKLLEPVQIGRMQIRNRIVMPAMETGYGTAAGYVSPQAKDYYEERAMGGVGLIIVEVCCVDAPRGKAFMRQLSVDNDKFIPGLSELAQAIQKHGAKAALQLHHAGNSAKKAITHLQPVGPSAIARPGGEVPRELSISEIGDLVNGFTMAAKRAQQAGFDAVEIHAAHGYLLAQFLSATWNKRQDDYGGTLENRARFLLQILQAIRKEVGSAFPVWCRINGEESGIENGMTLNHARNLAQMLEEFGVDAINVSAISHDFPSSVRPSFYPPGWAMHIAAEVKQAVSVPVIAVGRISPEFGERLLQEKKADLIAMGRALRADPELPNKLSAGRINDVRPCIACNACIEIFRSGGERLCSVNAGIGREREYRIQPAGSKKKVLIVGGGSAGMEAARVAALRGHEVLLFEKDQRLGGKLLLAAAPLYKAEIKKFANFLANQMEKLSVKIELNTEVTPALVKGYQPEVVILATGTTPLIPEIIGLDKRNAVHAEDVIAGKAEAGENVVVVGGGRTGCEVAALLAEKGKKVSIVEMLEEVAGDMRKREGRQIFLNRLAAKGVILLTQMKAEAISDGCLVIADKCGQKQTVEADTIVLACGVLPNTALFQELRKKNVEIHLAGDCVKPRTILEAVDDGARVAMEI
jgi:2,4-dienoyl-CoA reductase-like NADH-dependent reductase (Old Yellow Enzyme family)/thioredoxin reductase